ncbi:MAG TPA: hypothetical protein VKZ53_24185 [Candidatus Angelobacter sp.]|nr:hypothetical protein [Candidatus Angelobacter sp.]
MAELIVISKIDGNAVAWRCSQCQQVFSMLGKLGTEERRRMVAALFKAHVRMAHRATTVASTDTNSGQAPGHYTEQRKQDNGFPLEQT